LSLPAGKCFLLGKDLDELIMRAARHGLAVRCVRRTRFAERTLRPLAEVFLLNAVFRSHDQSLISMPALQSLRGGGSERFFTPTGPSPGCARAGTLIPNNDLFPGAALQMMANVAEEPET
jgi:hypothetical protein